MSFIQDDATYHVKNESPAQTRMELDKDEREVGASPWNNWPNQKWVFHKIDGSNTFHITSVKNGKFLALPEDSPRSGLQLIVKDESYEWLVKDESLPDSTVRIFPAEDNRFCVTLSEPSPAPGTKVLLMEDTPGDMTQIWNVTKV